LETLSRVKQHLEQREPDVPYGSLSYKLLRTRKLFLEWAELYREYTKGYAQEVLQFPSTTTAIIRMLSRYAVSLENLFSEIYDTKIPTEVYIIVDDMFSNINQNLNYAITHGNQFDNCSIYTEIEKSTKNLTIPGSEEVQSAIDEVKSKIMADDIILLYYERGQYDNPFYWPLLLHEALHPLYHKEGLSKLENKCPKVSWLQETLIDLNLMHYFGPIYSASSAIYLSRFPHLVTISHPPFIARLYASLLYLAQLLDAKDLREFKDQIQQTHNFVENTWNQYEPHLERMKGILSLREIEDIYENTEQDIVRHISSKTTTFHDLLKKTQGEKHGSFDLLAEEYVEKEVFICTDVLDYYSKGLPIAADPRILFNSFSSKRFLEGQDLSMKFICESLKKWYIKKIWSSPLPHA
jgi:hypothetical protein